MKRETKVKLAPGKLVCALLLSVVVGCTGCASWIAQESPLTKNRLLKTPIPTEDSIALEIFFARTPIHNDEINQQLWQEVDEQHLSRELRRKLSKNGFRAGVVNGQLPAPLVDLLHLTDEPPEQDAQPQGVNLEKEPAVRRRALQLRNGRRGEIIASEVYESLPLLMQQEGQVRGKTYKQAQGMFALHAYHEGKQQVRIALTPEVHYGQPRRQWQGSDGIMQLNMQRPRKALLDLELESMLTPGQLLVIGCYPNRPGSLGHRFFTTGDENGKQQKVLVIRLAQLPCEEPFLEEDLSAETIQTQND